MKLNTIKYSNSSFVQDYLLGDYDKTQQIESVDIQHSFCYLKVHVDNHAVCTFSYSFVGDDYQTIGKKFTAMKGTWIGAKVGLFNINPNITDSKGYADFDWFRFE